MYEEQCYKKCELQAIFPEGIQTCFHILRHFMISCSYLLENLSAETTNSNSILLCTTYKFTPTYSHTNPQTHKCIYIIITNSCIGSATDTHVIYRVCICTYQYIHIFIKSTYVCVCVIAFDQ